MGHKATLLFGEAGDTHPQFTRDSKATISVSDPVPSGETDSFADAQVGRRHPRYPHLACMSVLFEPILKQG